MARAVGYDFVSGPFQRELTAEEAERLAAIESEVLEADEREQQRREALEAIAAKPDEEPVTAGELRAAGLVGR